MEKAAIQDMLQDFIRRRYSVAGDDPDFSNTVNLFDYGYVDSFGMVDLIAFVESTFHITISESDLVTSPLNTIDEIAEFVIHKKAAAQCST